MYSSQNSNKDILLSIYQNLATVFRLKDIALLTGETNRQSLSARLNYYVSKGKLQNPRKGIYTKPDYLPEELAGKLYTPSYISLEYVLQKAGVVFQYDPGITSVSYLRRIIEIGDNTYTYRKLKPEILVNTKGVIPKSANINMATPERALLDLLYLNPDAWFDNPNSIDVKKIQGLISVYHSGALTERTKTLFKYD